MGDHKFLLIGAGVAALALLILVKKRVRLRMRDLLWVVLPATSSGALLTALFLALCTVLAMPSAYRAPMKPNVKRPSARAAHGMPVSHARQPISSAIYSVNHGHKKHHSEA